MLRSTLAAMISAALIFTPITATPAQADEDVAKVLAGIAGLFILKEVIDSNKENQSTTRAVPRSTHKRHSRAQRHSRARIAPETCLRQQWTHRGVRQVYGARCMARHARFEAPRECLRRANTNDGPRRFYTRRCLQAHGWRS